MTSRTNVTLSETTTYAWDEDNRLTLVTLPDTSTVAYTYDVLGRMLSRTDSAGTTTFVWDGWNCVQETDHDGNVTLYNFPGRRGIGTLMSFSRNGSMYQVHADTLGSIRKVTDSTGTVVATFDQDSYGNQLTSTSDSVPDGGLQYRYVGTMGIRFDSAAGLYYIRNRWYDPTLQRFINRDMVSSPNRYLYAADNPARFIDRNGLFPEDWIQHYQAVYKALSGWVDYDRARPAWSRNVGRMNGLGLICAMLKLAASKSNSDAEFLAIMHALTISANWENSSTEGKMVGDMAGFIGPMQGSNFTLETQTTGWDPGWKEHSDFDTYNDEGQAHHLVFYMLYGYYQGAQKAGNFADVQKSYMKNPGDVRLGHLGADMGGRLREGKCSRFTVANDICDMLGRSPDTSGYSGPWSTFYHKQAY